MMLMRLRQVVDLVHAEIHAAGSDLMQQRLPQMGAAFVDEGHVGPFVTPQLVAEPGHELQPAGAAADDDDAMKIGRLAHHVLRSELAGVGKVTPPPAATRNRLKAMLAASRLGIIRRLASSARCDSGKTRSSTRFDSAASACISPSTARSGACT